ncbi:hypothetical protein PMAYCL1PPCAC_13864, partial [Pristionchus mayeri]
IKTTYHLHFQHPVRWNTRLRITIFYITDMIICFNAERRYSSMSMRVRPNIPMIIREFDLILIETINLLLATSH